MVVLACLRASLVCSLPEPTHLCQHGPLQSPILQCRGHVRQGQGVWHHHAIIPLHILWAADDAKRGTGRVSGPLDLYGQSHRRAMAKAGVVPPPPSRAECMSGERSLPSAQQPRASTKTLNAS